MLVCPLPAVLRPVLWGPTFGWEGGAVAGELCRGEGQDSGKRETEVRHGNVHQAAGARHHPPSSAGVGLRDGTSGTVKITTTRRLQAHLSIFIADFKKTKQNWLFSTIYNKIYFAFSFILDDILCTKKTESKILRICLWMHHLDSCSIDSTQP